MKDKDILNNFIERLYDLSKMHYHSYKLDKKICLNYSANELDMAYECGYYEFIDEYYEEYLNRKDEFKFVTIKKENNDFIIKIDEALLKEPYIVEEIEIEEIPF